MNTIENNKLIAIFMGGKFRGESLIELAPQNVWLPFHGICRWDTINIGKGQILRYHTSWDWLMSVVEKIESLFEGAIMLYIKDNRAYIEIDPQISMAYDIPDVPECYSGFCESKIVAVYNTITQFITWYNQQSK